MPEISERLQLAEVNIVGLLGGLFWITFALMIIYIILRNTRFRNQESGTVTPPPELVMPSEFLHDGQNYQEFLHQDNGQQNQYPTDLSERQQRHNAASGIVDPRRLRFGAPIIPPPAYQLQTGNMRYRLLPTNSQAAHPATFPNYVRAIQQNFDFLISVDAAGDQKKLPCPICLGLLEEEPITSGPCRHYMHTSCLKRWLAKDVKCECPVCRTCIYVVEGSEVDSNVPATVPSQPIQGSAGPTRT